MRDFIREAAGRACRNLENSSFEQMESAIFNEIHRLESHVENLVRYDDVFIKKLKDSELQNMGQKAKIEVIIYGVFHIFTTFISWLMLINICNLFVLIFRTWKIKWPYIKKNVQSKC